MEITMVATGEKKQVTISPVEPGDFKVLTKKRYSFPWKDQKGNADLYKLYIHDEEDILGVMALINLPAEKRVEVKLLASAKENVGPDKIYDRIAGCLMAYACREAVKKYGDLACVSLVPKTELRPYYIKKYHMKDAGWQLFLEAKSLIDMIQKYL